MISVVVPVFNEEKTVAELHRKILSALKKQPEPFEIIFVDDGSSDGTFEAAAKLSPLTLISHERNCGQTAAIDTGIRAARGERIVLLDADLQNDPADILPLLAKMGEGFDAVLGFRRNRRDALGRRLFSKFANLVARFLLGVRARDFGCGLKAYRAKFIKDFRLWGESQVFLVAVAKERGARIAEVPVSFHARASGASKIRIWKMCTGAFDLLSVAFFVRYFSKPLRFFGGWGVFFVLLSFLAFASSLWLRVAGIKHITETPLPVVGALFAILGVILFMMGLLAEMLLRMYYEQSQRSPYLLKSVKKNE